MCELRNLAQEPNLLNFCSVFENPKTTQVILSQSLLKRNIPSAVGHSEANRSSNIRPQPQPPLAVTESQACPSCRDSRFRGATILSAGSVVKSRKATAGRHTSQHEHMPDSARAHAGQCTSDRWTVHERPPDSARTTAQ